jgi:hypothetical protein
VARRSAALAAAVGRVAVSIGVTFAVIAAMLLAGALTLPTPDLTCRVRDKTGHVVRSRARRRMFLKMIGSDGNGIVVNHIVPLRCGGCDLPSNMEAMSVADWKKRTGPERTDCGRHPGGSW